MNSSIPIATNAATQFAPSAPLNARAKQAQVTSGSRRRRSRFAALNGQVLDRTARLLVLAESAATADAELAARRDSSHAHIRGDFQQVADALHKHEYLAPGITARRAGDTIYALASPSSYLLLTDECGWSKIRYVNWLAATLQTTLTNNTRCTTRGAPWPESQYRAQQAHTH